MKRRFERVALAPDPEEARHRRSCEWPGCTGEGDFRAPQSREQLNQYRWFCLEHVRQYNRSWDYYRGMSQDQIEADLRRDTVWQRPTWPLGGPAGRGRRWQVHDGFGIFEEEPQRKAGETRRPPVEAAHVRALAVFELEPPVTFERLRSRYLTLVKLHHPDANGGDKAAEERLKSINEAYATLKNGYFA
ncbi:molecular chaperone DnaJ [Allostella vacuolata]|nr:molecular chaperone DnaJ [Stella vacuolata]